MKTNDKTTIVPKPREEKVAREGDIDLNLEQEPASSHFGARLRGYFLTGLIVVGTGRHHHLRGVVVHQSRRRLGEAASAPGIICPTPISRSACRASG